MRSHRPLAAGHALRVDIERIERLARGHEQAVALQAAEADIGAAFGQRDAADHGAVGGEHQHAVEFGARPCPSRTTDCRRCRSACRRACRRAGIDKHALVGELSGRRRRRRRRGSCGSARRAIRRCRGCFRPARSTARSARECLRRRWSTSPLSPSIR